MITRSTSQLVVEGPVISHRRPEGDETIPLRIEIDCTTGLIDRVGPPEGTGDLLFGDESLILPGLVDIHVHAREDTSGTQNYKEDYETAGRAAIHGGVTAFADMPNNPSPPVDDASYTAKREAARACPVEVLLFAGIGPTTRPLGFPAPYKVYMGPSIGHLFFDSKERLAETLARYRGRHVAFHAEDPEILVRHAKAPTHADRRPPEAEVRAIELAVSLCEDLQLEGHICHLSTADGLGILKKARSRGLRISCEVAPHHLYYDQDNASSFNHPVFLEANPPIRSRLDRIALLDALRTGEIDYLATDHAPHTIEEKEKGTSGVPHLDTLGAFLFWLHDEGVSWSTIREVAAERPGRFLARYLPHPRGKVERGFVGSLTILREGKAIVRREDLQTRSGWSPFEGKAFGGSVSHTIVRGKVYPQSGREKG